MKQLKVPKDKQGRSRFFISLMSGFLIIVLVVSLVLSTFIGFLGGTVNREGGYEQEETLSVKTPLEIYMEENGVKLKEGIELDEAGNIKMRAEDFPEGTVPGSEFLENMQPKFDFSLTSWFMELEDTALMFSRSDMDQFVVTMMDIFYGQLNEVYTLEELGNMPEVLELEDYLWERLGVTEDIEDIRSRLSEIIATMNQRSEEKEVRIERNKNLLFDNVMTLRNDFNNSKHLELFDEIIILTGLDEEDMTELVGIIVEVTMYHRSESAKSEDGVLQGSLLREKVVETTVEGLWNSQSHMAFMALDKEYQPLLSLLVELVVGQMESLEFAGN